MLSPDKGEKTPRFPVVCIGGSAGSLSAYVDILRQIPAGTSLAIVIVSHRSMENSDLLLKLLAKATEMEIVEANDGMLLAPGRIFVSPPHRAVTTDGVALKLAVDTTGYKGWPTVISDFIFSMASVFESRAIAIIVSGMGHDGSSAFPAIKEAGGWTFAQSDAWCMDMPQAAIDTDNADFVLSAGEIGKYLAALSSHLGAAAKRPQGRKAAA